MHKAILENRFGDAALLFTQGQQRHHLRLQVGWKAGVGLGVKLDTGRPAIASDPNPFRLLGNDDARALQGLQKAGEMIGASPLNQHIARGDCAGNQKSPGLNAVGNNLVADAVQRIDALNLNGPASRSVNTGAHCHEHGCQVLNFGFTRGVVQDGRSCGQGSGHHEVFCCAHGGKIEVDPCPCQPVGLRFDIALSNPYGCAELLQTSQMDIDRTGANGTAARG